MKYNPDLHHRRSIRLQGYDYTQPGAYFITICTANRKCLFGEVVDCQMRLNETGRIVRDEWLQTAALRPGVVLDAFVVMPNHVHGIIV
ncbi:MAG TPA: transposase, partial [Candidatus Hydrogenedentes bacterium]|nr:transposase [Candidatus Hydrogenedentota bacterium]